MNGHFLKKDLLKALLLTVFFVIILAVLLYLDKTSDIFVQLSQKIL